MYLTNPGKNGIGKNGTGHKGTNGNQEQTAHLIKVAVIKNKKNVLYDNGFRDKEMIYSAKQNKNKK